MTTGDFGWDSLTKAWHDEEPVPFEADEFRAVLRSRTRATLLVVVAELSITAVLIWVTFWLSGSATIGADAVFLTGLWVFWAVATGFAWWSRRGQWRLSVASSEDFVRLGVERAERKIRVASFTAGLLVAQVAFVVAFWLFGRESGGGASDLVTMLSLLGTIVAGYAGWTVWYYRRATREREHFAAVLSSMESAGIVDA